MANIYGVNHTAQYVTVPSQKFSVGDFGGRVRAIIDQYVPAGAISSGDKLYLGKIPKGAKVIGGMLSHTDLGSTGTAKMGWGASAELDSAGAAVEAADDDGLIASVDLNTAANVPFMWENVPSAGMFKEFSAEVDIILELTASTTAAGTINSCVLVVVD